MLTLVRKIEEYISVLEDLGEDSTKARSWVNSLKRGNVDAEGLRSYTELQIDYYGEKDREYAKELRNLLGDNDV